MLLVFVECRLQFHFLHYIVNCGMPIPPSNGSVGQYLHTREGATVTFWCNDGFRPSAIVTSICNSTGRWTPDPEQHSCIFVQGIACIVIFMLYF